MAKVYLKAAKSNCSLSQYYLGWLQLLGMGMKKDRVMAERWFRLAANNANEKERKVKYWGRSSDFWSTKRDLDIEKLIIACSTASESTMQGN